MLLVCHERLENVCLFATLSQSVRRHRGKGEGAVPMATHARTQFAYGGATSLAARAPYTAAVSAASPYFFKKLGSTVLLLRWFSFREQLRLLSLRDEERVRILSPRLSLSLSLSRFVSRARSLAE